MKVYVLNQVLLTKNLNWHSLHIVLVRFCATQNKFHLLTLFFNICKSVLLSARRQLRVAMQETSTRDVNLNINDSSNARKSNKLGKHGFRSLHNLTQACSHNLESMVSDHGTTLLEHVLIKRISRFDTDFTLQMKLTKPSLIHCFVKYMES